MTSKRILIISNNCLSENNSNGRTLLNLVREFPRDNISQIFTSGETSNNLYCGASLRVTNHDVVRSYFRKPDYSANLSNEDNMDKQGIDVKGKKTALSMLIRDLVWDNNRKMKLGILKWAKSQNPDVIILQIGDATLHISIAVYIAKMLNLKLITFNTEDYYFKNYDYMRRSKSCGMVYRLFHHRFHRKFNNMMKLNPTCIYNCYGLKKLYDDYYKNNSHVIYCGTDFDAVKEVNNDGFIIYAGNLGVGRHKSLIEIGKKLQDIDKNLFIDVYGKATDNIKNELNNSPGIRFHGLVSYSVVRRCIQNSRLLVHVESFDKYDEMDTRYAFSTKLADYLASGVPMFLYGPITGEGIHYVKKNSAGFVANNKDELDEILEKALYDNNERRLKSLNALCLAESNHNIYKNGKQFRELVS